MKSRSMGTAAVAACLVLPAAAAAHPSVYRVVGKAAPAGVTNPTEGQLVDQTRYAVNNDGYAYALRESNGKLGNGMVNYALLPGAFRSSLTPEQKLDPKYVTDVQPHATCTVASLTAKEAILAWQGGSAPNADPFFDYVPWQATSSGFGDEPAKWIPIVQARTGVNLATITDLPKACTDIGGTFVAADATQTTAASFVGEYVASFVDPLEARIAALEAEAQAERTTAAAEIARLTAANRTLALTAPSTVKRKALARRGVTLTLDGPPALAVRVRLFVGELAARRLGLKSGRLGVATGTTGGDYNLGVTLELTDTAAKALRKSKAKSLRATIEATAGDRFARKTIRLVK